MANLKITIIDNDDSRIVSVVGDLDKVNSVAYESQLLAATEGIHDLTLDFSELSYITSGGLRILLKMQLEMESKGHMRIIGFNETIKEVFDVTGFSGFLTLV